MYGNSSGQFVNSKPNSGHSGGQAYKNQQSARQTVAFRPSVNPVGIEKMCHVMPLFQLESGLVSSCEQRN